jgi:hypothetical protein
MVFRSNRQHRFRVTKHVLELRSGDAGVHGNNGGPKLCRGEHGQNKLGTGREEQGDSIPSLDAKGVEGSCQCIGPGLHLSKGDDLILMEKKGPFGINDGSIGQCCGDRHTANTLN